jgi:hypothetical protein
VFAIPQYVDRIWLSFYSTPADHRAKIVRCEDDVFSHLVVAVDDARESTAICYGLAELMDKAYATLAAATPAAASNAKLRAFKRYEASPPLYAQIDYMTKGG